MSDLTSADWADMSEIEFRTLDAIQHFAEMGRRLSVETAIILDQALRDLRATCLATPVLGQGLAAKRKANRLVRPLMMTPARRLPATQRSFAQLPARFREIYAEDLAALNGRTRGGFDLKGNS